MGVWGGWGVFLSLGPGKHFMKKKKKSAWASQGFTHLSIGVASDGQSQEVSPLQERVASQK